MAPGTTRTKQQECSPPKKKSKNSKMMDAKESLGEFESSIFDASDGHKLVDLIRRKKGLRVQTQKIFEDVPTHRPSLHIEIERLDKDNETLQPEEPLPPHSTAAVVKSNAPPTNCEFFVPKSPKRVSITRPITSPIIKMNSTTLKRRTLLKEFEKAFLSESRFLPQTCSTPISIELPSQPKQTNEKLSTKEASTSKNKRVEENIICTPITISDDGSPVEQNDSMSNASPPENSNTDHMMQSLIRKNELLNALALSASKDRDKDETTVNKENPPSRKSPCRTFTVECDITSGKITLSPAKSSGQNTERQPLLPTTPTKNVKSVTRKLVATPEQRRVLLSRLGIGLPKSNSPHKIPDLPQKPSQIPVLATATPASVPCLTNQETATAEFVERLQKNSTPNCPVIVIPVNQTFNQAPNNASCTGLTTPVKNLPEITSTMLDNAPPESGQVQSKTDVIEKITRVDSPASNGISSTTILNGEPQPAKAPSSPISSLMWEDIITDDASSSDCSHRRMKMSKRKKLSKREKPQNPYSPTHDKKKLSLSYKCLDLRVRVDEKEELREPKSHSPMRQKDKECHKQLKKKLQSPQDDSSEDDEQYQQDRIKNLRKPSRRNVSKAYEECYAKKHDKKLPDRFRRETYNINKSGEECENKSPQRSRQLSADEKSDEERNSNLPQRSVQQLHKSPTKNLPQRTCKAPSKGFEQSEKDYEKNLQHMSRREISRIADRSENNIPQRSGQKASSNDEFDKRCVNELPQHSRREPSPTDQREKQQQSRKQVSKIDGRHCDKDHENTLPEEASLAEESQEEFEINTSERNPNNSPLVDKSNKINENCDKEREKNEVPQSQASLVAEWVEEPEEELEKNFPQRSKDKEHENKPRSRREASKIDERCEEEFENNLQTRSRRNASLIDERENGHEKQQRSRRQASKINEHSEEEFETRLGPPSRRDASLIHEKQPGLRRETFKIDEHYKTDLEKNLPPRSRRDAGIIDEREKGHENQQRSRRQASKINEHYDEEFETNSGPSSRQDASPIHEKHRDKKQQVSRREASKIDEHCQEDLDKNLPPRSRREPSQIDEREKGHEKQQRSRRKACKFDDHCKEKTENNLLLRSPRIASLIDEREKRHEKQQRSSSSSSEIDEHREEELKNNLPPQSRRDASLENAREKRQENQHRSRRQVSRIEECRDKDFEPILLSRSGREVSQTNQHDKGYEKQRRSQRQANKVDQREVELEINLAPRIWRDNSHTPERQKGHEQQRSRREASKIDELENNLSLQSRREIAIVDERVKDRKKQQRSRPIASKIDEQCEKVVRLRPEISHTEQHEINRDTSLSPRYQKHTGKTDDKEKDLNISPIHREPEDEIQNKLSRTSRLDISQVDDELNRLRNCVEGSNNDADILQIEVLPPPYEFCDKEAIAIRKSESFRLDELVDEISSDKISMSQAKFQRPADVSKPRRRFTKVPEHVKQYLEVNKKLPKTKYLNVSKRKLYSKGNSDGSTSDDSSPEKSFRKSLKGASKSKRSLFSSANDTKRLTGSSYKSNSSRVTTPLKNLNKSRKSIKRKKQNIERNSIRRSSKTHFNNSIEPTSQTETENITITETPKNRNGNLENDVEESHLERRPSGKASKLISKEVLGLGNHMASDRKSHQEKNKSVALPKSHSSESTASPIKAAKQSNKSTVINKDVEENIEEEIPVPPPKVRPKKKPKTTKRTKAVVDSHPLADDQNNATTSTDNNIVDFGPRRSKRQTKPPTAYWACADSKYTHVYDIYSMLTKGKKPYFPEFLTNPKPKKKKTKQLPSPDDYLVGNTNTVESSSDTNTKNSKQTSKQKTKPIVTGSTLERKERCFGLENEASMAGARVSEMSTDEAQSSTYVSRDDTSSQAKNKAKLKTKTKHKAKDDVADVNPPNQDSIPTASDTQQTPTNVLPQSSTNRSKRLTSTDSSLNKNANSNSMLKKPKAKSKKSRPSTEIEQSSSDCPSESDMRSLDNRRLQTIGENSQTAFNAASSESVAESYEQRLSGTLMPPPATTNVARKGKLLKTKNAFRTEHDQSIANVSSLYVNNLFDQLKNSSSVNRTRLEMNSSGQVSLDNGSCSQSSSSSTGKQKNLSVRLQRMNFRERYNDVSSRNFDSGFSSEDKNIVDPKKDILLDWLLQMVNTGKIPTNNNKGLARFIQSDGYSTAKADELVFEEIDGVDFAFYNSNHPGQKFGYLRFKPRTQKKLSRAKRYELNFVLLSGTIQMTANNQSFDMKNGDLTTIFIGTTYKMKNFSNDPALVMVIKR